MSEPVCATPFAAGFAAASAALALPDDTIYPETPARTIPRNTADRFILPLLPNGAGGIPKDAIRSVPLRRPPGCAQYTIYNPKRVDGSLPCRVARSPDSPENLWRHALIQGNDRPDSGTGTGRRSCRSQDLPPTYTLRSEEHTSELQSRLHLVC